MNRVVIVILGVLLLCAGYLTGCSSSQASWMEGTLPSWSADGQSLAFVRVDETAEVIAVYVTGSTMDDVEQVYSDSYGVRSLSWSPDGSALLACTGGSVISIPVGGGEPTALFVGQSTSQICDSASYSPDGTEILFCQSGEDWQLIVLKPGSDPVYLLPEMDIKYAAWSPDGKKITLSSGGNIYEVNPDGTGLEQLTSTGKDMMPVWSRDGSRIAFISERDGVREVYTMAVDGSAQVRETDNDIDEIGLSWGPEQLAYAGSRNGGESRIYFLDV